MFDINTELLLSVVEKGSAYSSEEKKFLSSQIKAIGKKYRTKFGKEMLLSF